VGEGVTDGCGSVACTVGEGTISVAVGVSTVITGGATVPVAVSEGLTVGYGVSVGGWQ